MTELSATLRQEHRDAGLWLEQADTLCGSEEVTFILLRSSNGVVLKRWRATWVSIDEILKEADKYLPNKGIRNVNRS